MKTVGKTEQPYTPMSNMAGANFDRKGLAGGGGVQAYMTPNTKRLFTFGESSSNELQ